MSPPNFATGTEGEPRPDRSRQLDSGAVEASTAHLNRGAVKASTVQLKAPFGPLERIEVCGARGGQGASTVAVALALFAGRHRPARLVSHDLPAVHALLGHPSEHSDSELACHPPDPLSPAPAGEFTVVELAQLEQLSRPQPGAARLVVVRGPCYLALKALTGLQGGADGVVVVREPGRSLSARDVADIAAVAVVAEIDATAAVARTIDAGLFRARAERLTELASLRRWLDAQLRSRRGTARPPLDPVSASPTA